LVIDQIDRRILELLQRDSTMSVAAIAEKINLTSTPCWRRIQRLEQAGYILRRVAVLDREKLNCGLTAFIVVRTANHSIEWLQNFHSVVAEMPEVLEFHRLSGDIDYLIRVVTPDMKSYDQFYKKLIGKITLFDVSSMFSMEEIKSSTELPLHYAVANSEGQAED
jgi:Lrp/AsnC family transcriptional regulator